jgi:FYVE/RhoGEF/PH domain-containing protein 5/6
MGVETEGTPHRYVWQYSEDGDKNWCDVVGPRFGGANTDKLTVLDVQTSDGGFYRCVVYRKEHDQEPLMSTLTTLTVVSLPVIASPANSKRVVAEGAGVDLSVEVRGGSLTYQWQKMATHKGKQEHTISTDTNHSPNSDEVLASVSPRLARHYQVQYTFAYLRQTGLITADQLEKLMLPVNTNLDRVNLLMVWLPKAGEGYLDKFIVCLRSSSEDCPVHAEIADEIETALGRQPMENKDGAKQLTESPSVGWADLTDGDKLSCCREPCLRMLSVCGDNAGLYRCQVSNRAGMVVSDPIEVVLVGAPKVVCDLKDVRVPTTGQTSFNVEAVCEGSLTYVWQRKASNSTEWEEVSSDTKYQGQSTPSLVVTNVEKSDEGLIRCLVSSEGGQTYTREAFLRIENAIAVVLQPADTTVVVSRDLTLMVEASCVDPLTYTWQKRRTEAEGEEWEQVSVAPSNSTDAQLIITDVTESDAGVYRCLIRSKTGSSVISQPASVTVIPTGQMVTKFLEECESAKEIDGLAAAFVKEHGTNSQVTGAVLVALLESQTDKHRILRALLDHSAATDVQKDGLTLLHLACLKRHAQSVELLLEYGVDWSPATDVQGSLNQVPSPLHLAAERGYCNVMNLLLKTSNKAKLINAKNKMGQTALHAVIARFQSCSENQHTMEMTEAVRILVDNGARVDVQDRNLCTPLHLAASSGHPHIVYFLLNTDRSIANFRDQGRNTALHVACAERDFECATAILDFRESLSIINAQNEDGNTALHLACAGGFDEIVELLHRKGADKNLCNQAGEAPNMTVNSAKTLKLEQHFQNSPSLKRGIQRQNHVDTVPLKLHCGNTGSTTAATGMTLAGRDLEETCLSSLESEVMSPKKVFFESDWRFQSSCGQFSSDSLAEIQAMNRLLVGFKGTLPQYQDKVEVHTSQRKMVKQGPLVKFSRSVKSPRYFLLFSDVLVVTEDKGNGQYNFKQAMPLHFMQVGSQSNHSDSPLCFDVLSVTRSLCLQAGSEEEKKEWIQVLGTCIAEYNQTIGRNPLISDRNLIHAPIYEPDENVTKCQLCESEFTFTFRRHHCRACGKVVCNPCSLGRALLPYKKKPTRVCDKCLSTDPETDTEHKVLERAASSGEVLKRGYVQCLKTNSRMWYELDHEGALYVYKAPKDVSAERSLPLLGYTLVPSRGDLTLRLTHHMGDELFAVDDVQEFDQWKSAIEQVQC